MMSYCTNTKCIFLKQLFSHTSTQVDPGSTLIKMKTYKVFDVCRERMTKQKDTYSLGICVFFLPLGSKENKSENRVGRHEQETNLFENNIQKVCSSERRSFRRKLLNRDRVKRKRIL